MKEKTRQLISEAMRRVSQAMSKEQRQANGRKAWQTRIANLENNQAVSKAQPKNQ